MATSTEDLIASDTVQDSEPKILEDLNCTLCLKLFRSPRRLPCSHSFCQDCLQNHIFHNASVKDTKKKFNCPVCGTEVLSGDTISLDKWVHLFPHNTLLLSVLMKLKVKVDLVCDVCHTQNLTYPANEMCIVCEQALCENCSKMHGNLRLLNTHDILKIEELPSKQDIVIRHNSLFKCVDHAQIPLEFYCQTHETHLCCKCFISHHKSCSDVVELINETSNISDTLNNIKVELKCLEERFKRITDINVSNQKHLESQINDLTKEIRTLKQSINIVLDDLERRIKTECEKIYEEKLNKLEQLKLGCQSHLISIRNTNFIIEDLSKYASQSQMFLMTKGMLSQMSLSKAHIEEKYMANGILKLELEINPQLTSIMSVPRMEIAKIKITGNYENQIEAAGLIPFKSCKIEAMDIKKIKTYGDKTPSYTDLKYLSNDHVFLVDRNNYVCHLLDSLFNSVSFYRLTGYPWQIGVVDQSEIAVSMPGDKAIQFLSVKDNTITPTRKIKTQQKCYGIATISQDELIVSGPCGDGKKNYWSLITLDGKENSYHEFDVEVKSQTCVALNGLKTCFYMSVFKDNSLHCFGLDGKTYFTFKHKDPKGPWTVTLDKDDTVYVVGSDSHNVFQLSAGGNVIQIITNVIPHDPTVMCFNKDGDKFLLICFGKKDMHVFRRVMTSE